MQNSTHGKWILRSTMARLLGGLLSFTVLMGCAEERASDLTEVGSLGLSLTASEELAPTEAGSGSESNGRVSAAQDLEVEQAVLSQCPLPKPPTIGCKVTCKPCKIPVCIGGHWVYESIDWGPICDPRPPLPGGCCTTSVGEWCPPSCRCCTH